MNTFTGFFRFLARHARLVLIAGLVIGIALPQFALVVREFLPPLVALTLAMAALRIGPRAARGNLGDLRLSLRLVAVYQVLLPLALAAGFHAFGFNGALATALVLMAAAPSISGAPNIAAMTGNDPAPALRLLIAGVALAPLTVVPVFLLWPGFGSPASVASASLKLLLLIAGAAAVAFFVRQTFFAEPSRETIEVIDGASALAMSVLVIGLMSAVGPALIAAPLSVLRMLLIVFAVNLGLQLAAFAVLGRTRHAQSRVAWSVVAGNRNIALFLAALPASMVDPLFLFIGCYQVPMYLTPVLLDRLYRPRAAR